MLKTVTDYILTWMLLLFTLPLGLGVLLFEKLCGSNSVCSFDWKLFWKYMRDGNFFEDLGKDETDI